MAAAVAALSQWDPGTEPEPDGWERAMPATAEGYRYRTGGDKAKEHVG